MNLEMFAIYRRVYLRTDERISRKILFLYDIVKLKMKLSFYFRTFHVLSLKFI